MHIAFLNPFLKNADTRKNLKWILYFILKKCINLQRFKMKTTQETTQEITQELHKKI